jgi:hypothetical protein
VCGENAELLILRQVISAVATVLKGKYRYIGSTGIQFACSGISHTVPLTALLSDIRPDIGRTRPTVVSRTADL